MAERNIMIGESGSERTRHVFGIEKSQNESNPSF
jgi:hypothetical protein